MVPFLLLIRLIFTRIKDRSILVVLLGIKAVKQVHPFA